MTKKQKRCNFAQSGDGAGCGARLLKKYGANIIGGLHLKMPDCIGDVKLLKKTLKQNKQLVKCAENKIVNAVMLMFRMVVNSSDKVLILPPPQ